eukprot:scaffold5891_cov121-Isochrysis_galbana.AAC.4
MVRLPSQEISGSSLHPPALSRAARWSMRLCPPVSKSSHTLKCISSDGGSVSKDSLSTTRTPDARSRATDRSFSSDSQRRIGSRHWRGVPWTKRRGGDGRAPSALATAGSVKWAPRHCSPASSR